MNANIRYEKDYGHVQKRNAVLFPRQTLVMTASYVQLSVCVTHFRVVTWHVAAGEGSCS